MLFNKHFVCYAYYIIIKERLQKFFLDTIRNNVILKNWDKPLTQLGLGVL